MTRWQDQSTNDKGYDTRHRKLRKQYVASYIPGVTPCAICGKPMATRNTTTLHLAHTLDRRGYLGLAHKLCNEAQAAHLRADRMAARAEPAAPERDWATWDCCKDDPVSQELGMVCQGHSSGPGRCWSWAAN